MSPFREGSVYLTVRRGRGLFTLEVVKSTQRRPTAVPANCVVVKVQLRVPNKAFEPLQPEATVTVPEDLVQHPAEVEAV